MEFSFKNNNKTENISSLMNNQLLSEKEKRIFQFFEEENLIQTDPIEKKFKFFEDKKGKFVNSPLSTSSKCSNLSNPQNSSIFMNRKKKCIFLNREKIKSFEENTENDITELRSNTKKRKSIFNSSTQNSLKNSPNFNNEIEDNFFQCDEKEISDSENEKIDSDN